MTRATLTVLLGALCALSSAPTVVGDAAAIGSSVVVFEQWHDGRIAVAHQAAEAGVGVGGRRISVPEAVQELHVTLRWTSPGNVSDLQLRVFAPDESARSFLEPSYQEMWSDDDGAFGAPDSPASVHINASTWKRFSCTNVCNWTVQAWPNTVVAGTSYTIHVEGFANRQGTAGPAASARLETPTTNAGPAAMASIVILATCSGAGLVLAWRHRLALWVLAPRIRPENALDHPVRRTLLDTVRSRPGLFEKEFQDVIDVSWGTLIFHLTILARAGIVETRKLGRHRCYFVRQAFSAEEMDAVTLLRSSATIRVASALEQGPLSRGQLRMRLGLAEGTTTWHLVRLERHGLVRVERTAPRVVSLSPLAVRALRILRGSSQPQP